MSGSSSVSDSNGHAASAAKKRSRDGDGPLHGPSPSLSSSTSSKPSRHATINIDDESNGQSHPLTSSPSSSSSPCPPPSALLDEASSSHLPNTAASGISSEYRVWKKNSPYLYDIVLSAELEWPSLTVQFLPDRQSPVGKDYAVQRLLLGTQTDGKEGNYVMIAEVKLPTDDAVIDAAEFSRQEADHEKAGEATAEREAGGYGGRSGKLDIVQRIPHPSEVNRARYMPHNPDVIVTRGVEADLFVFDRTRYASKPVEGEGWRCDVVLEGHQQEGYGMSWSVIEEGRLVSCAGDARICVWDINAKAEPSVGQAKMEKGERKAVRPTLVYLPAHAAGVNDVAWHYLHPHLFASGADDSAVKCWDSRQPASAFSATHTLLCHGGPVNSVAFSPLSPYLLASGSDDHTVAVWDVRASPSSPLHRLSHHHDSVMQVSWAPFDADVLGSVSADRRVNLYDISRGGEERKEKAEEEDEDDVRLLFQHGGHTDKVGEMSWNGVEGEEWMIATVSDDNIVQVWQPAENLVGDDDDDEEDEENGTAEEPVKKTKTS